MPDVLKRAVVLVAVWAFLPLFSQAQEIDYCHAQEGAATKKVAGFTIQLIPSSEDDDKLIDGCRAVIRDRSGRVILRAEDFALEINEATGLDVNNDGAPEIVIEGYSGGAHCCWTYWIVSTAKPPGLARTICNLRPVDFGDSDKDGKVEMRTLDGTFDYFDSMSHAFSPFPIVVLQLDGKTLRRINTQFWHLYAREIANARRKLRPDELKRFKQADPELNTREDIRQNILRIVLAYLYGGREREAWKTLAEYWPPSDSERIRAEILKEARRGFLGNPNMPSYGCSWR